MSDADVASFMSITCSNAQQAKQFLEMSNGNLERAIELYYQNPQGAPQPQQRPQPPQQRPPPHQPRVPPSNHGTAPGDTKGLIDDIFQHAQNQQNAPPEQFDPGDNKVEKIKVTFWKNGFQVEDGEFRSNDDPQNQEFLQAVSRGMIPRELQKPGVELDVEIDDNRDRDYKPKPKPFNPFSGNSRSLGSGSGSAQKNQTAPPKQAPPPTNTNFATPGQPSTKIRLQLPDQLLMFTVNLSATVGNLKGYILQNRPDLRGKKLKLDLAYPPQALTDDNVTIEQAKLKMAQITVTVI
ncbi:hypothetical protein M9Y10_003800 [Tritrichomonas musculus]|uniref:SEP domain-containing protein n=1 Tax=Tritrichomonas musculus TaxID=1915356 RepID=A0ABR2JS77_9EUKA